MLRNRVVGKQRDQVVLGTTVSDGSGAQLYTAFNERHCGARPGRAGRSWLRNCPLNVGAAAIGCTRRAISLNVRPGPSSSGTIVASPAHNFVECLAQPGQLPLTPGRKVLDDPPAACVPQDPLLRGEGVHAGGPASAIADQHGASRATTREAETSLPPRRLSGP